MYFNIITNIYRQNRKYNFALKEYYSRVDYTIKNFTSLKGRKGAESDRGRIYIIYGKPTSTERNYNEKNETIEIWKYASINKIFVIVKYLNLILIVLIYFLDY